MILTRGLMTCIYYTLTICEIRGGERCPRVYIVVHKLLLGSRSGRTMMVLAALCNRSPRID